MHGAPSFIFFGTPEIGANVLEVLVGSGYEPLSIVTNPDRLSGRSQTLTPPPVKRFAAERNLRSHVLQPEKFSDIESELVAMKPDFFVVAAYAKIIPRRILAIPRLGTIGVHPSLLPLYRGPSPIQTAILDGAAETGVTLYHMDEKMDEGPVLAQKKLGGYRPGEASNAELSIHLAKLGGEMLVELIPKFLAGTITPHPQDHARATYTKKFSTEDAFVAPDDLAAATDGRDAAQARAIHQTILAFTPEPGAWTTQNGKRVKLLASEVKDGALVVKKIQREGKTPREVEGF